MAAPTHFELYGTTKPTYEDLDEFYIYIKTGPDGGIVISETPRNDLPFEPTFALFVDGWVDGGCDCCGPGSCKLDVEILKGQDLTPTLTTKEVK